MAPENNMGEPAPEAGSGLSTPVAAPEQMSGAGNGNQGSAGAPAANPAGNPIGIPSQFKSVDQLSQSWAEAQSFIGKQSTEIANLRKDLEKAKNPAEVQTILTQLQPMISKLERILLLNSQVLTLMKTMMQSSKKWNCSILKSGKKDLKNV
jgi:hypothetical protein